jgi:putative endonuclease
LKLLSGGLDELTMWGIFQRFATSRPGAVGPPSHLKLGELGEKMAAEFLRAHGYRLIATNFLTPIGSSRRGRRITGEIDIIAYDESSTPFTLVFAEVKTRTSAELALPEAAVNLRKQRQIVRAARIYRRMMAIEDEPYRYDVVSLVLGPEGKLKPTLLPGYFTEKRYVRAGWF